MPSLQVRDLPEHIYRKLQIIAEKEHRSFSQQAVVTLSKGLDTAENPKERRRKVVQTILEDPVIPDGSKLTDPVELIRKDRDR